MSGITYGRDTFIGLDIETSGLNPWRDTIVEIAIIIADKDVNVIERLPVQVIGHIPEQIDEWPAWTQDTHRRNGLIEEALKSTTTIEDADAYLSNELYKRYLQQPNETGEQVAIKLPMTGASVHFDRDFIRRKMPKLHKRFTYRNIDISVLLELSKQWAPEIIDENDRHLATHRAAADIELTFKHLRRYKRLLFSNIKDG